VVAPRGCPVVIGCTEIGEEPNTFLQWWSGVVGSDRPPRHSVAPNESHAGTSDRTLR
jgi:hypothetical protein